MSPTVDTAATLVRLANRIGEFFAAFPEREEALDGIAQHLAKFWEPRMRRALYAHLDGAAQGEGLAPLVREAAQRAGEALAFQALTHSRGEA